TEFRATELQSFADHPEKRSRGWRVRGLGFSVNCETDHHALPISATRPAGKAERLLSPAPRFHSTVCEVANNLPGGQGITGTRDVLNRARAPHLRGAPAGRRPDHARRFGERVRRVARARAPDRGARLREGAEGGEVPRRRNRAA